MVRLRIGPFTWLASRSHAAGRRAPGAPGVRPWTDTMVPSRLLRTTTSRSLPPVARAAGAALIGKMGSVTAGGGAGPAAGAAAARAAHGRPPTAARRVDAAARG